MDPCLARIIEANSKDIKHGKIGKAVHHAKDYLAYVNGHDTGSAEREYKKFVQAVKNMRKRRTVQSQ